MYNEKRNSKSFAGRHKHKALNSECESSRNKYRKCITSDIYKLKSCRVLVSRLNGDEWNGSVKKNTGPVSKVNLFRKKGKEGLVESYSNEQDSSSFEYVTNVYKTIGSAQSNCKGSDRKAPNVGISKKCFNSRNPLDKPYSNAAVVNSAMKVEYSSNLLTGDTSKNSFLHNGEHVEGHKNGFNRHSVTSYNTIERGHDSKRSSCSKNEDKPLHKPSGVYSNKKRYSVDSGSHMKSSCDKNIACMEPSSKKTDFKFEKSQTLESAITMHNIKPCSVMLSKIDYMNYRGRELRKDLFKNESKDVSRDFFSKETKSSLVHAYIKHKRRLRHRIQKNAIQKYLDSIRLEVNEKDPSSLAFDEDTNPNRFNAPFAKSKVREIRHCGYQNYNSNRNRTYFNDSTPSTSSSSFFDEIGSDWSSNEYIRKKYPEFFQDGLSNSDSDIARNFLKRINQLSMNGFNRSFNPSGHIKLEATSEQDDTNKNQSHNLFVHSSDNELPPGAENKSQGEEDSGEDCGFSQKNKIASNKDNGSDSESKVEGISNNNINDKSHHNKKSNFLPAIKPFFSLSGKKYIVDSFKFDNIEKMFVTVRLQDEPYLLRRPISQCTNCGHKLWANCGHKLKDELDSSYKHAKCEENFKDMPVSSQRCTESGENLGNKHESSQKHAEHKENLENRPESSQKYTECRENLENKLESTHKYVEYERNSENKTNTVSKALDVPGTSDREIEKILSESANSAINFSNSCNNNNKNLTSVFNRTSSPPKQRPKSPSPCCDQDLSDSSEGGSVSPSPCCDQDLSDCSEGGSVSPSPCCDQDLSDSSDEGSVSPSPCCDQDLSDSSDEGSISSNTSSEDEFSDISIISVNENNHCVHCFYVFLNRTDTYNHTCPGKRERGFLCIYCERIFPTDEEFQAHSKMHEIT